MAELQTDYDIKGVIQDLKENKYSDDEIKGFLKNKFGDQTVQMFYPDKDAMTLTSPPPSETSALTAPVAALLGGAATAATIYGAKKLKDRFLKPKEEAPKIEPTFGPVTESPTLTTVEKQLQGVDVSSLPKKDREMVNTLVDAERKRMERQQQATGLVREQLSNKPGTIPTAPTVSGPLSGKIDPQTGKVIINVNQTPSDDIIQTMAASRATPPPTVAQIAAQVAPPVEAVTPTVGVPPEPAETPTGKKTGRPTKAEQEAKKAALAAFVPPAGAEKIPSEWGKGMGWLVGAYGVQGAQSFIDRFNEGKPFQSYQEFENKYKQLKETELFGPTFQQVPKDIRKERGIVPSSPQFKKEAGFAIPQPIPGKQSGATSLGGLLGLLASGGLMYAGTTPQAQAAMQRASGAIRDIGISPDLLQGKGEELGRLGTAYVTAGNPQYRQQLLQQINIEKDPVRYNMLLSEYQKAGGNVPGGRGAVIPPR